MRESNGLHIRKRKSPYESIPKPKNLSEVPGYLWKITTGFFTRFFYILHLVWETKPALMIFMSLFCVLNGVLPVVGSFISAELINEISIQLNLAPVDAGGFFANIGANFSLVLLLLGFSFLHQFLTRIVARLSGMVNSLAGELVTNHIKLKILNKAREVDLASFDRPEFYEKMENANREAGMRPIRIMEATFSVISTLISAVSFIVVLAGLHPAAPWLIIALALPTAIVNFLYRNRSFWYIRWHSKERRQMNYYSNVVVDKDKVKEMRIMGLSDTFIGRYKETFGTYYKGLRKLIVREALWQIVTMIFALLGQCALFIYVAYSIIYHDAGNLGDYSLYTGALTSINSYVSSLISSTVAIYEGTLFIDNMMVFMREPITVKPTVSEPVSPKKKAPHTIEFRHVSFYYPGTDRRVIDDISLVFEPGEQVALVGLNGAGKTTFVKLMTRLYDPTEGAILLDGVDLRHYRTEELYDLFGVVFQDFGKYAVSVSENISFGDVSREPSQERVEKSAEMSNSSDFISGLPSGFDTPLMRYFEDDGIELSIGQWQKLSVARAFYKDSDILILDEPTASLDALAEQEIYDQFAGLSKDKITVFVSHRLSSATSATKIVVLDGGKLVETGTHEELMALHGEYFKLFSTQAKRYTGIDYDDPDTPVVTRHYSE